MKIAVALVLYMVFVTVAYGQSTEYSMQINTGYFYFSGGASPTVFFEGINGVQKSLIEDPYGNNFALSYSVAAQIQRITKKYLILGLQLGTQLLRSRVMINTIGSLGSNIRGSGKGHALLSMDFINLYPNIGQRFLLPTSVVDLTIGPEIGLNINSREKGMVSDANGQFPETTNYKISEPFAMLRLRSSLTLSFGKWGLTTSYAYGFQNYKVQNYFSGLARDSGKHFSQLFMFGIIYKY